MKVLIADDDPGMRSILQAFISMMDHDADLAENGTKALEMLKKKSYDVVITDGFMPEMTGFELCRQILKRHPRIYIVGITGSSKLHEFQEAGAHAYYYKPIQFDQLRQALGRFDFVQHATAV